LPVVCWAGEGGVEDTDDRFTDLPEVVAFPSESMASQARVVEESLSSAAEPAEAPVPDQWSRSVRELVERHDGGPLPAGQVIAELLASHPGYLDERLGPGEIGGLGPARTAAEHAAVAMTRWDPGVSPLLDGRRLIVALAMEAGVGWPLLQAGVIASLTGQWRPSAPEPDWLVWDLLSDEGRTLADEQPLLAAALGAPAEWSVSSPARVGIVVWAPSGDKLAFLAGDVVYEAARGGSARRVGVPPRQVLSLGWGLSGVVALCVHDGTTELIRIADGTQLGAWTSVDSGVLSGDGTSGWLRAADGLLRLSAGQPSSKSLGPAAVPLAVDRTGSHVLVDWGNRALLLWDGAGQQLPASSAQRPSDWPTGGAQVIAASSTSTDRPCALVTLGQRLAVASASSGGGVAVEHQPFPPVASIATGSAEVTALATDPAGTALAVASGDRIDVWPLFPARPSVREVPGYDSDRIDQDDAASAAVAQDLLDADRDARALAALIASAQLRGPMAIGLFGAWGSGKSFVLSRIRHMLAEITSSGHAEGYLDDLRVVRFNAWQYAEVNLWASLVDEVLTGIGPVRPKEPSPQVQQAEDAAREAEENAQVKAAAVAAAERDRRRVTRRRRVAWAVLAATGVIAAGVVVVAALGASARLAAGYGAVVALLTLASAAAAQVKRVTTQGQELREAGLQVGAAGTWVAGQVGSGAVQDARQKVLTSRHDYELAWQEADRLRQEASRVRELSVSQQLGSVLQRMSVLTEYRDQLSLVARTRDRFEEVDAAVTAGRMRRTGHPDQPPPEGEPEFERVVVMIDDLDRCPAEKVVTVLEAVHLLFDFEMFVVVIAVDTRWLDQSLRIRYQHLLGEAGAAPSDYLEKIIQVPLHLTLLDEDMVRGMIGGLTGVSDIDTSPALGTQDSANDASPGPQPAPGQRRAATKPRPPRAPLPAETLRITQAEAATMSAVAPLVGTTPRTVKRYVNTYRLLKARARDLTTFDEPADGIADHEIVAFLLAVVTGHPELAALLLPALASPPPGASLGTMLADLELRDDKPGLASSQARLRAWLAAHPSYAGAAASRFSGWALEVGRFSFSPAIPPAGRVAKAS
jgi:KAP family P-loop domain